MNDFHIVDMVLKAWDDAGNPYRQSWIPSVHYGDEPLVVVLAKYAKSLEDKLNKIDDAE